MNSLAEVMYRLTAWIMRLAPLAVFALMVPVVAANGPRVLLPLISVVALMYGVALVHGIVVYSLSLKLLGGVSPIAFFKAAGSALAFAFSTTSSAATLPFSMECTKKLGVSQSIRSFVLPLGSTINMDGNAIYQGVCALFIAHVYGIELTVTQMFMIVLVATLASIGAAGVPGAALVMLGMVLESVGLPMEGIALVAGIDRILDMARTTLNVAGDMSCAVIVAASEHELDPEATLLEVV